MAIFDCWEEHYDPSVACSGFGSTEEANADAHELLDSAAVAQAAAKAHNLQNQTEEAVSYSCYSDSSTRDFPVNRMVKYINSTAQGGPPTDGKLYTVQCLWQESASSVTGILSYFLSEIEHLLRNFAICGCVTHCCAGGSRRAPWIDTLR